MKKCYLLILPLLALAQACIKDFPLQDEGFVLTACLPEELTKVTVSGKENGVYPVSWQVGDIIRVNGVDSRPLAASSSKARFSFSADPGSPYNIVFGAAYGRTDAYELPSVCHCDGDGIRGNCMPMCAVSESSSFTMKHLCCLLHLTISGIGHISSISVQSLDSQPLAGCFRLLETDGIFNGTTEAECTSDRVDLLLPANMITLGDKLTYCIPVAPVSKCGGIAVDIYAEGGKAMRATVLSGVSLEAGKVYEIPELVFTPNIDAPTEIADYASLKAFAARVASGEHFLRARLSADIAVDADWTPIEGFKGEFDGGGHTVSGLRKALFNELRGSVSNLVAEGNISISGKDDIISDENVFWAGILTNRIYTNGTVLNCITRGSITYRQWGKELSVGAISGYAPRGVVRGCVNRASVTALGDGSAPMNVGGMIGRIYSGIETIVVDNCLNEGVVTAGGILGALYIGGVVGRFDAMHTSSISNALNAGTVSVQQSAVVKDVINIGGVAGLLKNDIVRCSNYALVRQRAASDKNQNVGGIAGSVTLSVMTDCIGAGSIVCEGAGTGTVRCGGIAGYAAGDAAVSSLELKNCIYKAQMKISRADHAVYARAFTGLYSIGSYSETFCVDSGKIIIE